MSTDAALSSRFARIKAALGTAWGMVWPKEFSRWSYVLRCLLAMFLAMWVAMLLNLDKPSVSMATVAVVMQPQPGAVLGKSIYRMLGNCMGGLMAVLLFAMFGQQPGILLVGLAAWVAFCTIGASKQRDVQSYGFVLAGYTACIIALPDLGNPQQVYVTAYLRVSEVFIGILAACLISETVFPKSVSKTLNTSIKNHFELFKGFVCKALQEDIAQEEMEKTQMRFLENVAELDSQGIVAFFEPRGNIDRDSVRLFNSWFMSVSTSFHSVRSFLLDTAKETTSAARMTILAACKDIAKTIDTGQSSTNQKEYTAKLMEDIKSCRKRILQALQKEAACPEYTHDEARLIETGAHVLRRFLVDMEMFTLQYANINTPPGTAQKRPEGFTASLSKNISITSGARAALLLLGLSLFWWATALPNATGSTMTSIAVVFCALIAADPAPARSIFKICIGAGIAVLVSSAYTFLILPQVTELPLLVASYLPLAAIGFYLGTVPSTAGAARLYCVVLASFSGPGLIFSLQATDLVSRSMGQVVGIILAGVLHITFFPVGGAWWQKHMRKGILKELYDACTGKLEDLEHFFESGVRDILLQFSKSPAPTPTAKRTMLKQALDMSSLGRIIIELREYLEENKHTKLEKQVSIPVLEHLSHFLDHPVEHNYNLVILSLQHAMKRLEDFNKNKNKEIFAKDTEGNFAGLCKGQAPKDSLNPGLNPALTPALTLSRAEVILNILHEEFALTISDLGLFKQESKNVAA